MACWTESHDPHNPENRVAGGLSDLVKHTVYLCALQNVLGHRDANKAATIYECHAGRGMYRIPQDDIRSSQLAALRRGLVYEARERLLRRLGCGTGWYPGSAALVADFIQQTSVKSRHLALEWAPETRGILRQVCAALDHPVEIIEQRPDKRFDGESFLVDQVAAMAAHDLILLDPFALFRQQRLDYRRQRYWRLLQQWTAMPRDARPSLLWFFSAPATVASIEREPHHEALRCSYESFVQLLAEQPRLQIDFDYEFPCRMWLFAHDASLAAIQSTLGMHLAELQEDLGKAKAHRIERINPSPLSPA